MSSQQAAPTADSLPRGMFRGSDAGGLEAHWAFSTRWRGKSIGPYGERNLGHHVGDDEQAWRHNRAATATELGVGSAVFMHQVHGDAVAVVERVPEPSVDHVAEADALVTAVPGICLAVMVADCVPLLMADVSAGVVAAVHAGRKGVLNGVALRALEAMERLGARRESTSALIGPAICGPCYEVPPGMAEEVVAVAPEAAAVTPAGTPGLDLRAGLAGVLREAGTAGVEVWGPCTRESADFYSYRAAAAGRTGRFAGFVWLAAPPA